MKWFLLKRYATPSFDLVEDRGWFVMSLVVPAAATNAYVMAEDALWFATTLAIVGVLAIPQRPTAFEAALPIRGRDIAIARLLWALGLSLTTFAISSVIVAKRAAETLPIIQYFVAIAVVALGVLLPRLVRPKQLAMTPGQAFPPLLVLGPAVAASLVYLPDLITLLWVSAAAVAAGVVFWKVVPDSFQTVTRVSTGSARDTAVVSSAGAAWWRMVPASLFSVPRLFICAMLVFGAAFGNWWLFAMNSLIVEDLWQRSRWTQTLPISRRGRLWMIFGPGVILPIFLVSLGLQLNIPGFGYLQNLRLGAPGTYMQEAKYFDSPTNVSMEYWERAPNGLAPTITSPWGETTQPYVIRVFSAVYYNPYTSREANSDRFDDWQFRKLTTMVYGFPVALKDYDPHAAQPKRRTATPRMLILNIGAALSLLLVVMFLLNVARMHVFWRRTVAVSVVAISIVLSPMALMLYISSTYGMEQGTTDIVMPLLERQLLRLSAMLPSNIAIVLAIVVVPVLASYALVEWQFNRSEIVGAIPTVNAR